MARLFFVFICLLFLCNVYLVILMYLELGFWVETYTFRCIEVKSIHHINDIYTIRQELQFKEHKILVWGEVCLPFCSDSGRRSKVHADGRIDPENRKDC